MAEELTTGTEGQSSEGTETTTQEGTTGQSGVAETQGTTSDGTQQSSEETFFDPRSIEDKPELMSAYKQMQRAFTEKTKAIKADRQKIEAYDAFYQDPLGQIQQLASQMGYQLTRAQAQQVQENAMQQQQGQQESGEWEPKSWDEVLNKATEMAYQKIQKDLSPVFNQVKELRESNLERFMDDNFGDWRMYEDEMMDNLKAHPSLVNDPTSLYRMSVPPEVLESRATQAALKKLQTKAQGSKTSEGSTTKQRGPEMPDKPMTFDEAVAYAQKSLAAQGITRPH